MRTLGIKRIFLVGLAGDVAAMSLLVASQSFIGQGSIPYVMLLLATTSLGVGFGLTVPAINTFAAAFAPAAAARAVLYLNALLGLGHGPGARPGGGLPGTRLLVGAAARRGAS